MTESSSDTWWRSPRLWLFLLVMAHLAAVLGLFGVETLRGDRPVIHYDLAIHYHRAEVLRESGGFPGLVWDPGYMGGYPVGGTTCVDNRLGEIGVALLPWLPPGQAWNWTLAFCFALVPGLLVLASRWAECSPWTTTLATGLGLLVFWSMRTFDLRFIQWGLYGWAIATAGIPLLFTGLHRCLSRPSPRAAVSYGLAVAFLGLAHALTAVLLPFVVVVFLGRLRQVRRPQVLCLAGAIALAVLLLLPCALPVIATLKEMGEGGPDLAVYFQSSPDHVRSFIAAPERIPVNAILLLALVGLVARRLPRSLTELALAAFAVKGIAALSFLAPALASLQPTRFLPPALFLAVLPAAEVGRRTAAAVARLQPLARVALFAVALALIAPYLYVWVATAAGRCRWATEPHRDAAALVAHLRDTTRPDARVMVEDDGTPFGGHFGAPHLVGCLASEIDRQILGGPHMVNPCRVGWANFVNGKLLDRDVQDYGDDALRELLEAYNVGTIVAWSPPSQQRFRALGLEARDLAGGFTVFRTGVDPGFAAGAAGVVAEASFDTIRVRGATTSPTLLRWNFDPRFRTDPPLPLKPAPSPFSRVGFVLVENGAVQDFVVRFVD